MDELDDLPAPQRLARRQYELGMRALGRSLIALGALQALGAVLMLSVVAKMWIVGVVFAFLAALLIGLGIFALQQHFWVNFVVMVLASLLLVLNLAALGLTNTDASDRMAQNPTTCIGFLILIALIYYAAKNVSSYLKAQPRG